MSDDSQKDISKSILQSELVKEYVWDNKDWNTSKDIPVDKNYII